MVNNITLTSSMRSNLASLRTIALQMSKTQERLSFGKKVNSAIDNASSFYQARSLTNRAADLNALLDSMEQGIQTIQAATTGLEKAGEFLEQAAVIAQESYETAIIPEKSYFEAKVGENGAVVSTAQELKDAVDSGKETICVYGKIDYFENETLTLQTGQKLVGTEYFTGYTGNKKFSEINFKGTQQDAIKTASNSLISDLSLIFETSAKNSNMISCGNKVFVNLNNLEIDHTGGGTSGSLSGTIKVYPGSLFINGQTHIKSSNVGSTFGLIDSAEVTISEGAQVKTEITNDAWGTAIIYNNSQLNIYGKLESNSSSLLLGSGEYSGNRVNIYDGAEVTLNYAFRLGPQHDDSTYNSVNIESGAKVNLKDNEGTAALISQGYVCENKTSSYISMTSQKLRDSGDFTEVSSDVDWDNFATPVIDEAEDKEFLEASIGKYQKIMNALDDLVADTSYQGINLLNGGDLNISFNESRTNSYTVSGSDMTSMGLGITVREWVTKQDVLDSINEIKNAMNTIRDEVARLGNSYSIIQTRENFTDKLIDILETGADNLVLADMNEESADYLSLQVRNNLAINALSLASQSAQSVLKLF